MAFGTNDIVDPSTAQSQYTTIVPATFTGPSLEDVAVENQHTRKEAFMLLCLSFCLFYCLQEQSVHPVSDRLELSILGLQNVVPVLDLVDLLTD